MPERLRPPGPSVTGDSTVPRHAAVVLAGGAASRMGGASKPELRVGGRTLVQRVVDASPLASPHVVVGDVAAGGYIVTREDPPGSGPAYALSAGLGHVPASVGLVAVLAADHPFLTADLVAALCRAVQPPHDGAVLIDHHDRPQWLCGVWRHGPLAERASQAAPGWGMRQLLGPLRTTLVAWNDADLPPWFDCDTPAALNYARHLERAFGSGAAAEPHL